MKRQAPTPTGDVHARRIPARHFFNTAFKDFSLYDNVRSIPRLTDGLKPAQRKAIYGTQLRGENAGLIQVERLASAVAASTDYHHGVGSLASTIVGMANNYPGSNNCNLFVPEGQFGSRLTAESAAHRYIETKLSPHFRALFPKADDQILEHHETDGEKIEPKTYAPLLPMVLVNGAQGTGTGHACLILSYNPGQVRDACLQVLASKLTSGGRGGVGMRLKPGTLVPWFNGFGGTVERNTETGQVVITGKLEVVNTTTIKITELPIGTYLDQYKDHLNKLEDSEFIKDYEDRSTESGFDFTITVPRSTTALSMEELYKKFKLISRDTENFTVWNINGVLQRFESAESLIEAFVPWRLSVMETRRQHLIADLREQVRFANEVIRFIRFYLSNVKVFRDTSKKELVDILLENRFVDYERLLAMQIWSLTKDRIAELEKKLNDLKSELAKIEADTAADMYKRELKAINL
jgi:DNA topoisomerase-2